MYMLVTNPPPVFHVKSLYSCVVAPVAIVLSVHILHIYEVWVLLC
jgi:hypothetical protein